MSDNPANPEFNPPPSSSQFTLSVVDQSPMRRGGTPAEALAESVKLAQTVERLGYKRYWVAEHHSAPSFAGTSPELLIGQIAAQTRTIRVGSGGVMLSHYSALKVAEQFRILDSFFPGRIDLGIGRAPGSDQLTAAALAYPRRQAEIQHFPQQVLDLIGFINGKIDESHPFSRIHVLPGPIPDSSPEVWLLGSSTYSAQLAAQLGMPFSFADFFGNTGDYGPSVTEIYRNEFQASNFLKKPKVNVTFQVICAPTEKEAILLGASRNLNRVAWFIGMEHGLFPPQEAADFPLTEEARQHVDSYRKGYRDSTPDQVRDWIVDNAERYQTHDIGLVTNCYSFRARVRSYKLLAQAFGITSQNTLDDDLAE
ncbi:LLM class flavin-dependent oxidoreductase [SAR202 cluster bacterium AD-804-J14_MRT_500m]|nr:LLM class flavin-dependent oxidoreductase [SAR202 cluster bacterium AD-804-J14_MRT_500m]